MTTVFIAGSITIKHLDPKVTSRIDKVIAQGFGIVVGDADGVDAAVQRHLLSTGASNTIVYCSGSTPRTNLGDWPIHAVSTPHAAGTRSFFTAKDLAMADAADFGLMVWDRKSAGTLKNVVELLARNKKSVVFVNDMKSFVTVGTVEQLETLVGLMSEQAARSVDRKVKLFDRIASLKDVPVQAPLFT